MDGRMTIPALHRGVKVSKTGRWLAGHARHRGGEETAMARFALHKTFNWPKDSECLASSDRFSEVVAAWEDEHGAGRGFLILNTEDDSIVWTSSGLFAPAPERAARGANGPEALGGRVGR